MGIIAEFARNYSGALIGVAFFCRGLRLLFRVPRAPENQVVRRCVPFSGRKSRVQQARSSNCRWLDRIHHMRSIGTTFDDFLTRLMAGASDTLMQQGATLLVRAIWAFGLITVIGRLVSAELATALNDIDGRPIGLHLPLFLALIAATLRQAVVRRNPDHIAILHLDQIGRVVIHWMLAFGICFLSFEMIGSLLK